MFIAIEGIIGIGKSTLQSLILERFAGQALIQEFDSHPYIDKIYADPDKYAIETEMIFLLMAYHQLFHRKHEGQLIISDFTFDTLNIFASMALNQDDYEMLYLPCYRYLSTRMPKPDLVIRITGSVQLALSHIRKRERKFETELSVDYLAALKKAYDRFYKDYNNAPVIIFDAENRDFLHEPADFDELIQHVESTLVELKKFRK